MVNRRVTEFDLLEVFTTEMEREGVNHKSVRLDIDAALAEQMTKARSTSVAVEDLQRLADKCLANAWLEHAVIGAGKYGHLVLTSTGVGVIRSRQRKKEALNARTNLKKISDYIEDHKGLFVALGALIALAGLLTKLFVGGSE